MSTVWNGMGWAIEIRLVAIRYTKSYQHGTGDGWNGWMNRMDASLAGYTHGLA